MPDENLNNPVNPVPEKPVSSVPPLPAQNIPQNLAPLAPAPRPVIQTIPEAKAPTVQPDMPFVPPRNPIAPIAPQVTPQTPSVPPQTPQPKPPTNIIDRVNKAGTPEYTTPLQAGQYPLMSETPVPAEPVKAAPLQSIIDADLGAVQKPRDKMSYKDSPIETLRTFESDVARAVKKEGTSVIKMAVAEQKRKIERHEIPAVPTAAQVTQSAPAAKQFNPYRESRKNLVMIFASIFLIIAGGGIGFYVYTKFSRPPAPLSVSLPGNPIISTDHEQEVQTGSNVSDVLDLILAEKNQTRALGSVSSMYFTKSGSSGREYLSTKEFLSLVNITTPESLERALDQKFMLGVHMIKGGKTFLILKTNYYEGAFPGMLEWEQTMIEDLIPLFGKKAGTGRFQDKVIQNKDTRETLDGAGNVDLIYSFFDKKNIIIAEDEETIAEISRRLTEALKTQR